MQPAIRYVRSADGVSIAYWAMGDGSPLVIMPSTPFSHVQLEWEFEECREWYQRLMQGRRVVRYDARGFGLSEREAGDFSLEANVQDLEAVIDRIGEGQVALYASGDIGIVAVSYAARHPERVSHLVLWCSYARRADVSGTSQTRRLRALVDFDWETYTETVARTMAGWSSGERFLAFFRRCTSLEVLRAVASEVYEWDVTPLLPQVTSPVLVMQRSDLPSVPVSVARDLASALADCRLVMLEGSSPFPWVGGMGPALQAIGEFLGGETTFVAPSARVTHGSVTILFTDMESSTPLTSRLGDEGAQELVRAHNRMVREALRHHSGSERKHTGDGIMASFGSAGEALECAVAIQRAVAYRNDDAEVAFRVRIGINAGEPVEEESDLFGTAVQRAARIRDTAQPGEILVSNVVRELVAGKGFAFEDRGKKVLKGFEEPVRLFALRYDT
ncbi:MAG TPA: adenylate/guanylate cyclase domain-containing protein [Dehalococcoidia bacterium]|nr:adenylate/guanylate cyclase domain-containing protein [Dehalococcoidia bacterium]